MPGLRDILDAAMPAPWSHTDGPDDDWGFVAIGESGGHGTYGFDASHDIPQAINDARLIALAPELAALCLAQNEEIQEKAKQHHRSWGHAKSFKTCDWPICESARDFGARLSRLGAGDSNQNEEERT